MKTNVWFLFAAAFCAQLFMCETSFACTAEDIARYESGGELAVEPGETAVDAPKGMKLILCIGQSNMAGRGELKPEDKETVEAAGLKNQDRHHFNREAQIELGKRYYEAWKKLAE